ncbi:PQQ-dependent sugar dehydrogenase [Thermomonas sp.]|jgi:glucose/arabinose dehydrogenase|uniref:PQQ-dependent sugar dehydrogenase n=1 Tax=Thermomonas sp. TaxID=1971895 RepID=UPI001B6DD83F|nr:PQQ-dependent sugar dehydrogenase [Thermomonas sp.]MBP6439499.1 PQQ-dependent sugar dehydrogenase [Thermomonas sp.]MBP7157460.1 PQQ-dependent sugar dehydrogenase [Thermomonas sp.]MBP7787673.1 PQQ-dependent sugar dehydrogenase [Thermomonas sp.]MBP8615030.1 PQQ-dependent sugar dehydrogenase [Thermomonas sp.]MBP8647264.1 PQQ-dependent sugar dehydrogenase [Thermomonas sp.]
MTPMSTLAFAAGLSLALNACAQPAPSPATGTTPAPAAGSGALRVETVATGLEHPWSVALLPEGGFLVSERPGRLRRIGADGQVSAPIAGVPEVFAQGQGGLLDVVLDPGYAGNRRIWLSYAEPGDGDTAGTAVATATLAGDALTDLVVRYRQLPKLEGSAHFGSRIAFDGAGHVFISQGERNRRAMAQDLDVLQGKLVRLHLDGSVPADNPFANASGVRRLVWSYGHRNMQGLAVDPRTGSLWQSEHGPRGGDEINLPQPGRNYGWPVITHGINYSGFDIPEAVGTAAPGMEQPHHVWAKSPALSGMAFLTGHPGNPWNDSLLLGALAGQSLIRLQLDGNRIVAEERLLTDLRARIRDVRVGADGTVYVLTDAGNGQLLRLLPPDARRPR